MTVQKARRQFDGEPHQLVKTGRVEAWFYNNSKTIDLVVTDNAGKTLSVTIRKARLRQMAEMS